MYVEMMPTDCLNFALQVFIFHYDNLDKKHASCVYNQPANAQLASV